MSNKGGQIVCSVQCAIFSLLRASHMHDGITETDVFKGTCRVVHRVSDIDDCTEVVCRLPMRGLVFVRTQQTGQNLEKQTRVCNTKICIDINK